MHKPPVKSLKRAERFLVLSKVFFDGLDRVGVTVLSLSVIGGLLAPAVSAMTATAAITGGVVGFLSIIIGGYLKERTDATLKDVRGILNPKPDDNVLEHKPDDKFSGSKSDEEESQS